jgi:Ca-activated chloride channel family protein
MDGESIGQARNALLLALRSLEEGDRFNVIGFGSSIDPMFKNSIAYSQSSLDDATKKVQSMNADLGGTELLDPLKFILEPTDTDDKKSPMPRQVVLLTDGQVGNESELIELATKHATKCRIFTFGIGVGASEHLVRALARASGGQAEFIHPNERIEPKVLRQFSRMASASLTNVRVDWGTLKTDLVAPSEISQLFDRDRLTIYGRVVGGTGGEVAVLADGPEGVLRFPVQVDLERPVVESAIPVLMARKAIQELEEGRGAARRGSAQTNRKPKTQHAKILELALRYQLMSSATSFVAVEERAANTQSQPRAELRRIPVALTKGWGAAEREGAPVAYCSMSPASIPMAYDLSESTTEEVQECYAEQSPPKRRSKKSRSTAIEQQRLYSEPPQKDDSSRRPADYLLAIIVAQQADGSFEASKELCTGTKVSRLDLETAARMLGCDLGLAKSIVATLLALEVFHTKFADRIDEWRMLADKAERWLAKQKVPAPKGFADLKTWAKSAFKTKT